MKKEIIIKGAIFSVIFLLSLFFFNNYYSGKNEGVTEMVKATLPVMEIRLDGMDVNRMHGYMGDIDEALLRDAITPVEGNSRLSIAVTDYEHDITAVHYRIYYGSDSCCSCRGS